MDEEDSHAIEACDTIISLSVVIKGVILTYTLLIFIQLESFTVNNFQKRYIPLMSRIKKIY